MIRHFDISTEADFEQLSIKRHKGHHLHELNKRLRRLFSFYCFANLPAARSRNSNRFIFPVTVRGISRSEMNSISRGYL